MGLRLLILWASAPLTGAPPPRSGKAFVALALLGLGNNALPFALIAWGQTHLAAGLTSILNAATPLFAVLVAHVFTAEEKLGRFKIIGAVAGMAGVAWVIGPDPLWGASGRRVGGRRGAVGGAELRRSPPCSPGASALLGSSPSTSPPARRRRAQSILCPLALFLDPPWSLPVPSPAFVASVFAIAGLCAALAYVVFFRILSGAGATNVLLVTLLAPATLVILGALFLHERLLARQFFGFALIAIGLAFIDGRLPRALLALTLISLHTIPSSPLVRNRANLSPEEGQDGDRDPEADRSCRACRQPAQQALARSRRRGRLAAGNLLPAARRSARKGARMVRALPQSRLYDRDRILARACRTTGSSLSSAACRPLIELSCFVIIRLARLARDF